MTGDPRLDDLKRLERDFATAMEQLYAVGNGLARLRHDVEGATSPTAPPQQVTQPPVAVTSHPGAPVPPIPQMPPVPGLGQPMPPMTSTPMMPPVAPWEHPAAWPPREPTNALSRWWRNESVITRVLGVAGAIVTLAGLVMLLVLAVQQQWFGPVPRVVLGALLALTLIGLSLRLRHRERAAGRSGHAALALAATGYAAAYLVVVAVTATYGWLPPVAGLALALLVVGSGLVIARRWDSQFLAVLLLLGAGLMVPSLVDHSSWVLSAFMVVLALGSWPVQLGRTWPWATLARVLPAALVVVVGALANQFHPAEPWAHVGVTTVLALGGLLLATLGRGHAVPATAIAEVAATATPLLVSLALTPMPWRTVLFLLAGVAFLGYAALGESQRWLPVGLTVPATGVGTLALLLAVVARSDGSRIGTGLLVLALIYTVVAALTRSRNVTGWALLVTVIALLTYLRHPFTVLVERSALDSDLGVTIVDSVVAVGLVVALAWLAHRMRAMSFAGRRVVGAASWVFGLVVATTGVVAAGVLVGRAMDAAPAGFRAGHALATILWMVAAAWLLILGLRRAKDSDLAVWLGLGLAAAAVAKLFVYDLAVLAGIWRVVAFIVVGLLLLATGAGYAKALDRARKSADPAPPPVPPSATEHSVGQGPPELP
ncbi:MAG: DUF2339 domain-containing protein [Actinobacteria bacterium]|nr:DUF2339 domain-containing protein [Actinomycetota bacterium]